MALTRDALEKIMSACAAAADRLRPLFVPQAKFTILIRVPNQDGQHVVFTEDTLREVARLLNKESDH